MRLLLRPLSFLWNFITENKNRSFDVQKKTIHQLSLPVVSVGNLTMGGTGKTSVVMDVAAALSKSLSVAVICKSYRGQLKTPARVIDERPDIYGDEAVLLARNLGKIPVFSGPTKWQTAGFAEKEIPTLDLLILDDGFQHRQLRRQFDLVVLDATEAWNHYRCFPEGRARESWKNLKRAQAVVVTRTNLVSKEDLKFLISQIPKPLPHFFCELGVAEIQEWDAQGKVLQKMERDDFRTIHFKLVSGLGRPEQFSMLMNQYFSLNPSHLIFRDHHAYQVSDFAGTEAVVTTEKDAVKIIELQFSRSFRLFVVKIKYEWQPGIQQLTKLIQDALKEESR